MYVYQVVCEMIIEKNNWQCDRFFSLYTAMPIAGDD